MVWTRVAAAALLLTVAAPSQARFDVGNVGLPTGNPGIFDPGDPPVVEPPPPLPPLGIQSVSLQWIDVAVRAPAGRTSQLLRQPPGGTFAAFRTPTPGVDVVVRDQDLRLGQSYCYRLDVTGGGKPDESHTRCATTDWRVGFEGLTITEAESATVLQLFDWRDTQALAPGTDDEPALYHMNVLLEGGDPYEEQALRYLGMHVQAQPIFSEELEGWNDARAVARQCPLGPVIAPVVNVATRAIVPDTVLGSLRDCVPVGRWAFAAIPGAVYNELRVQMLDQIARGESPGIRAIVFRRVPVNAALAQGVSRHVLNYVFLGEQGFAFNGIARCTTEGGVRVCEVRQELLGWIARKVIKWVAEIGDAMVEGVRRAIGRIKRLVKGEVSLDIDLRLLNTDPAFGTDEVMRSGWSGEELELEGVKVEVRQGLAGFYGHTDADGHVRLTVAKNASTKVCIQLENDTAELTEYLLEKTVCVKSIGSLTGDTSVVVDVRHDYANALAGMSDARRYFDEVLGLDLPKITVLVGEQADGLAAAGRSFAPCMGRMPGLLGLGADLVGVLGSLVNPAFLVATTAVEFFYSVDIVLRSEDDSSRGVPVHEYAHTAMCNLLSRQGFDAFQFAWTDVILATSDQSAGSEASYINEAFADFISSQVVGGTNYFAPSDSVLEGHMNYCEAGLDCVETNFRDASSFRGQVARVVSLLHDAFDGHDQGAGPNDGSHWTPVTDAPFAHVGAADSDNADETAQLPGARLLTLFEHWDDRGTLINEDNFLGGLADLLKAEGMAETEVCALFALHDASRTCPGYVARRGWLDWGVAAQAGGLLQAFALAPTPAGRPGVPVPYANAAELSVVAAIAASAPAPEPGTEPAPEPGEETECADCSRVVVFEGVQKLAVPRVGRSEREATFAFRLGAGAFEGIDPLGQLYTGAWSPRDAKGRKLRLHLDADATGSLEALLAASAAELDVDAGTLRAAGPAKIELRVAKGGSLVGKIALPFEVEVEGDVRRGTYVAKLRSEGL